MARQTAHDLAVGGDVGCDAHDLDDARAKALPLALPAPSSETEQATLWASQVLDAAFAGLPTTKIAGVLDLSAVRVRHFRAAGMAFLRHMRTLAGRYPDAVAMVGEAIVGLGSQAPHVAGDPAERIAALSIELGDFAREVQLARADGRYDAREIERMRLELRHIVGVAMAGSRDLDALSQAR